MGQLKYHNGTTWVPVDQASGDYSTLAMNEALVGVIDGVNKVFTTTRNFTTISVYMNGMKMMPGALNVNDYAVTGTNQITFTTAPRVTTPVTVISADYSTTSSYIVSGTNSFVNKQTVSGLINGVNATYVTGSPYMASTLQVFINGIRAGISHVTETNPATGSFTLDKAPETGDVVEVAYMIAGVPSGNADTLDGYHLQAIFTALYPVGSVFQSTSSTLPPVIAAVGTWTPANTIVERQLIATKVLQWSTGDVTGSTTKQAKLGVYAYYMLDDMLMSTTNNTDALGAAVVPAGYHVEYKLTAEVSTSNANTVAVYLNNMVSNYAGTYSGDTFRRTVSTDFFKRSDIILENTTGYSQPGINFGWVSNSGANNVRVYIPTLSAFLVRDTPYNKWERTA